MIFVTACKGGPLVPERKAQRMAGFMCPKERPQSRPCDFKVFHPRARMETISVLKYAQFLTFVFKDTVNLG
jgi:hypothetical protein